ncbi:MAG: DHHA1 domain-containing protein, partial [Nevskiales bacterium]
LNAAGRLDDMSIGVECLLSENDGPAQDIAQRLDQLNRERREIQQQMQDEALSSLARELDAQALPVGLCLYDPGWHQGITGLVAGKVKERYHRPVIAFAPADDQSRTLKGSARSVAGFHIRDALDAIATQHPGLIARFGGHAMAAGLSLEHSGLEAFRAAFDEEARRWLDAAALEGVVESDGELTPEEFTLTLAQTLQEAGPWGQGFPDPVFDGEFEVVERRIVAERHLKLRLRPPGARQLLSAIAFNQVEGAQPGRQIRAAFRLAINEYAGQRNPEAVIEYLEVAD